MQYLHKCKHYLSKDIKMWKNLALGSLVLWLLTLGAGGYFFINGSTDKSDDGRLSVSLKKDERNHILGEMRQLLSGVQVILEALTTNDLKVVEKTASSLGMRSAADVNPALIAKLPLEFKSIGMSVHERFDEIAQNIHSGKMNKEQVLHEVSDIMLTCVGCHEAYRLDEVRE